jgi:preprotein translocase subunit SecD
MKKHTLILLLLIFLTACSDSIPDKKTAEPKEELLVGPHATINGNTTIVGGKQDLETGFYYVTGEEDPLKKEWDDSTKTYFLDPAPIFTSKNIRAIFPKETHTGLIELYLDSTGKQKWNLATKKAIGKNLAFVVNNELIIVLIISEQIETDMANFSVNNQPLEKLHSLKEKIRQEIHLNNAER